MGAVMKRIYGCFDEATPSMLVIGNILFVLVLGLIDYYTGIELSFSIFYLLPVSIMSWYVGKCSGVLCSIVSAIVWFTILGIRQRMQISTWKCCSPGFPRFGGNTQRICRVGL